MFVKRRWNRASITALAAAVMVLAVGLWGAYENGERRRYRRMIESMYERSFYELVGSVGSMQVNFEKLLVSEEPTQTASLLGDIRKQAGAAENSLSVLPASHPTLSGTVKFVNQVGDFSGVLAKNVAGGKPIDGDGREAVENMLSSVKMINQQLERMQPADVQEPIWNDAPADYYALAGSGASPVEKIEKSEITYPTLIYDGPFSEGGRNKTPKRIESWSVTQEDALGLAVWFYGQERVSAARPAEEAFGAIPSWGVELVTEGGTLATVHVAKLGGRVQWLMRDPASYETDPAKWMELKAVMETGKTFLELKGFGDMRATYAQIYDGLATINYAANQDDVLLYPDLIKLQLTMTDASVVGVEAGGWLTNHVERDLPTPLLSAERAQEIASANLEIERTQLTLIPTPGGAEKLCWECAGVGEEGRFLVYIDASDESGKEIDILKLIDIEGGQLTL